MPELEFTLRLNSPAFAGSVVRGMKPVWIPGGQGNGPRTVEVPHTPCDPAGIRIPTLRGVLEFWLRTLYGDLDGRDVFAAQGRVFGSTAAGQGLSIRPAGRPDFRAEKLTFVNNWNEFLYLGYGPLQLAKDPATGKDQASSYHAKAARDALLVDRGAPGFRFIARGTEDQLRALQSALILLHLFGGVGGRSRRGWGSVAVEADGIEALESADKAKSWVGRLLGQALALRSAPSAGGPVPALPPLPRHTAFSQGSRIRLTQPLAGGYEGVLRAFYAQFQATRLSRANAPRGLADKAIEAATARSGQLSGLPARLAFGLPYSPESRRSQPPWKVEYQRVGRDPEGEPEVNARRASPLLLKVHRVGDRYFGVALHLDAEFFGEKAARVGAKGVSGTLDPPGPEAIREFLNHPQWVEVDPNRCEVPTR